MSIFPNDNITILHNILGGKIIMQFLKNMIWLLSKKFQYTVTRNVKQNVLDKKTSNPNKN